MKKTLTLALFCSTALLYSPIKVQAQMMGGWRNANSTVETTAETHQDEAEGKAVWDKLQDKQTNCSDLTEDDFDVLGDFFMGNMMGNSHDSMNQTMKERLGDEGEKQMHITMGKRLSGCDTNATFPQGSSYFTPMMGFGGGMMGNSSQSNWGGNTYTRMGLNTGNSTLSLFHLLTWFAAMTFLISGSIYFVQGLTNSRKK